MEMATKKLLQGLLMTGWQQWQPDSVKLQRVRWL
jgi:hypothetical protein